MLDAYFHSYSGEELHTYSFIDWNFEYPERTSESEGFLFDEIQEAQWNSGLHYKRKDGIAIKKGMPLSPTAHPLLSTSMSTGVYKPLIYKGYKRGARLTSCRPYITYPFVFIRLVIRVSAVIPLFIPLSIRC